MSTLSNVSDEDLVNLLRANDDNAMDEIFNRYWQKLFIISDKVLLDKEASKDIVQNVLISIWERRQTFMVNNLNAFLIQSVKYQISYYLRKDKFTERLAQKLESVFTVNNTEETIDYKDLKEKILESLEQVPSRCKEIFFLSRFENLSNQEIANKLQISIRTVETQISNALRFLRTDLDHSALVLFILLIC